jgi:multidrug resistance efflux pump
MLKNFRLRRSIDKIDLHVRLSALENRLEQIDHQFHHARSAGEVERMKADLLGIVKLAAEHLNRAEEGHAEGLADVEALRAELEQFRTTIGSAIGVTLEPP